jgi:hypothetical protein
MDDVNREARERELDERARALDERLDRFFAFQLPVGASLEDRVQNLERHVTSLRRLVVEVAIVAGPITVAGDRAAGASTRRGRG